jgi:acetylornithine deacetylase/succinyl-diaminopimelate desuccinylase-like protein
MKGGIAASMAAMSALAQQRLHWAGEVVLTLAGDEESMGPLGTKYLLDHVPHATGAATIIGDAGSPMVLRFGEKGFIWIEVMAEGKAAHGAHVHLGVNAMDRLREALDRITALRGLPVTMPEPVRDAIARAKSISEPLCGAGEADVLSAVTVNIGIVTAGVSPNLVPSSARAALDIRLPVGVSAETVLATLRQQLDLPGITWRVLRCFEPNHTDPGDEIVVRCAQAATDIIGTAPAINMRVGGSDARWFRMAGIPTVVYGPTPYNMGAPDEYADIAELAIVSRVHALTAFDFLINRESSE